MFGRIRRPLTLGVALLSAFAVSACANLNHSLLGSVASNAAEHSQQGLPCTRPPVQAVQVATSALTVNVSGTASFTACAQFAGDFTLSAAPSGIVSIPSSVTPAVDQDDGIKLATITVTGVSPGTATITVTDKKDNTATVTVTVIAPYEAYVSQGSTGISIFNENGTLLKTLPIPSNNLALDDAGNIYSLYHPTSTSRTLQRYAPGSTTPNAAYQAAPGAYDVESSGLGEISDFSSVNIAYGFTLDADVWNQGSSGGAPSYTLSAPQLCSPGYDVSHDGTLYLAEYVNNAFVDYAVFPPGSTSPSRTIPETIVPADQLSEFCPNYMAVGSDGTLYVTEYTYDNFGQPDVLAGLYIYPPTGAEKFVATTGDSNGAGPQGVDVDASGNIYVANNNEAILGIDNNGNYIFTPDTLREVEVFAPGGVSVLRHITGDFDPHPLTVAPDGTVFVSGFGFGVPGDAAVNGTYVISPGSTTLTQISSIPSGSMVLYNGFQSHTSQDFRRQTASYSATGSVHSGGRSSVDFRGLLDAIRLRAMNAASRPH